MTQSGEGDRPAASDALLILTQEGNGAWISGGSCKTMTSAWGFYYYFLRPFLGQPRPKGIEEAVPRENGDCEGVEEAPAKPHCGYRSKVAKQQAVMPTPLGCGWCPGR